MDFSIVRYYGDEPDFSYVLKATSKEDAIEMLPLELAKSLKEVTKLVLWMQDENGDLKYIIDEISREDSQCVYEQLIEMHVEIAKKQLAAYDLQEQVYKLQRELLNIQIQVIGMKRDIIKLENFEDLSYVCPGQSIDVDTENNTVAM